MDLKDPEVQKKLKQVAKLMEMPLATLLDKLDDEDKSFVVQAPAELGCGPEDCTLDIKGIYNHQGIQTQTP